MIDIDAKGKKMVKMTTCPTSVANFVAHLTIILAELAKNQMIFDKIQHDNCFIMQQIVND